ncbi:MAG: hypothetical protein AW12_02784 [Candidatus Accumulibacter sp. BA-94]|nr:MAG: hypothetical protein AW12_02784 [Candidatus Accumulibacter sp. BA-94]
MGRQARRSGALDHRQPDHLCLVDGGLLHHLDLLWQRRACRGIGNRLPAGVPGSNAGDGAGLDRAVEDDSHRQGQPHHVDRRLHLLALWQEPWPRWPGDDHCRDRDHSLHRAATQGSVEYRQPVAELSGNRHAASQRDDVGGGRHQFLHCVDPGGVHHRLWYPPSRCHRTPRRDGRGDCPRVRRQAGRLSGRRHLCHLRYLRWLRRHFRPR